MIKFHGYHFGRLRPEKIFAEFLEGGVIRLGCFEILFGGIFQFRLRSPGIRGDDPAFVFVLRGSYTKFTPHSLGQSDESSWPCVHLP